MSYTRWFNRNGDIFIFVYPEWQVTCHTHYERINPCYPCGERLTIMDDLYVVEFILIYVCMYLLAQISCWVFLLLYYYYFSVKHKSQLLLPALYVLHLLRISHWLLMLLLLSFCSQMYVESAVLFLYFSFLKSDLCSNL